MSDRDRSVANPRRTEIERVRAEHIEIKDVGTAVKIRDEIHGFLSRGGCYCELTRNVDQLPNICAQQCVDEGFWLCIRHNLHRTGHMRNRKQRLADSQLTA